MIEKFNDNFTCPTLDFAVSFFDTAFLEDVDEGENLAEFLGIFDFDDTAHNVAFEHDFHDGIADAWGVKESDFVFQKLFSVARDFHER